MSRCKPHFYIQHEKSLKSDHLLPLSNNSMLASDVTAAMLMERTIAKTSFGNLSEKMVFNHVIRRPRLVY